MAVTRSMAYEEYIRSKNRSSIKFSDAEVILAKKYLKNPTNAGLWRLEARWLFNSPIANEINNAITSEAPKLKVNKRMVQVSEGEMASLLGRTESISFYLRLFARLTRLKDSSETLTEYIDEREEDGVVMSLLDFDKLSETYTEALSHFEKNMYTPDIDLRVGGSYLTRFKSGSFICLSGPGDLEESQVSRKSSHRLGHTLRQGKKKIELISLSSESLKSTVIFFQKLGIIDEVDQYAIFSPEEEVLSPYVDILQKMIPNVFQRKTDRQFFNKMIGDYQNENYTGCIGTSGLVAEDCLTQIYETIYRTPVPRKMTLGSLQQKIGEAARSKTTQDLDQQVVTRLLKQYKEDSKTNPTRHADINSKLLLRYIEEKYKKLDARIQNIEGKSKGDDFFPAIIRMNLEDIIRFRNAASHKSLDPVGSFEALKSIYCSFSLVTWWDEEKRKIDWSQDQGEVIKQFVRAARSYGANSSGDLS